LEIDRWALAKLDEVIGKVRAAYEGYEFHLVYHLLSEFCTVTLSARYFDIIKDRLYTFAPRNQARRSAQTALYRIADSLARMLAPILAFTADEIWENLPPENDREQSVHLALLPSEGLSEASLLSNWERLFEIREDVLRALEEARVAKQIGSSLEARVELRATGETYEFLKPYERDLPYLFIVSQVILIAEQGGVTNGKGAGLTGVGEIIVGRAEGQKCERCWNYSTHVGESSKYPSVCERCVNALEEIEEEKE
jgi:isoleucyl-tRNA synthetase